MYQALASLTLSTAAIQQAAAILVDRRRRGIQGAVLPETCRPHTLDDALAIQGASAGCMNDSIAAWKCGTPGPGKLVVAPIHASTVYRHTDEAIPSLVWARDGQVRVEPELAFRMGADMPWRAQPWLAEDVDAAIAATHLALELIDSRYEDAAVLSFADKLADGLVNQGLFIGPEVDGFAAMQVAEMSIGFRVGGGAETLKAGRHPDPLPRLPLYWLAEFLRQQGLGLRAGQFVITGSYAGTFPLPIGQPISVRHGDLGRLSVQFAAR
jgi:2-keto-4-pentenoate hydratase